MCETSINYTMTFTDTWHVPSIDWTLKQSHKLTCGSLLVLLLSPYVRLLNRCLEGRNRKMNRNTGSSTISVCTLWKEINTNCTEVEKTIVKPSINSNTHWHFHECLCLCDVRCSHCHAFKILFILKLIFIWYSWWFISIEFQERNREKNKSIYSQMCSFALSWFGVFT